MKKIAIIVAGGTGSRMGQDIPKQFLNVLEKPVIIYTLEVFEKHPNIDAIIVVCLDGWKKILNNYAKQFNITKLASIVSGGKTSQESIRNGLIEAKRLYSLDDMVLIHDGIRPMVSSDIISDNINKCQKYGNATVVIPCMQAILEKKHEEYSEKEINRDSLVIVQTPQTFILKDILSAHEETLKKGITAVASSSLYTKLNRKVYFSDGSETNIKLTRPDDLLIFEALLNIKKNDWIK